MRHELKLTADGFPTIFISALNEHYHSTNGAYNESKHVFIEAGLLQLLSRSLSPINILEVGMGTGLNVLMTQQAAKNFPVTINYVGLEPFPLPQSIVNQFAAEHFSNFDLKYSDFETLHKSDFDANINMQTNFSLIKSKSSLEDYQFKNSFHLVYFDAFGPQVQPEIWSEKNFKTLYHHMFLNGILVTYSAKGAVRRAMQAAGFSVERLAGPPGKREMLRATKMPV